MEGKKAILLCIFWAKLLYWREERSQDKPWRAAADCQDTLHTMGLSAGTPYETTSKHNREAPFCLDSYFIFFNLVIK